MQNLRIHFVGVAGVGMSGLARACVALGSTVTGSDRFFDSNQNRDVLDKLAACGVRLLPQDGSGVTAETDRVVVSTAIEEDNPDIRAARVLGLKPTHRAAMLAEAVGESPCIAIAGTSGKTTVTGMVGVMLEGLGADPMVVDGGAVLNWATEKEIGNVRVGRGPWVIEADESDKSLMRFHPDWAIVTNISSDHFPEAEARALFADFGRQVKKGVIGPLPTLPDGASFQPQLSRGGSSFQWGPIPVVVPVPGRHNAENAFQSLALAAAMGFDPGRAAAALAGFKGIGRRLQTVGTAGGITVVDDYAHNPAKIEAAWITLAPQFKRILGVWRPHGFGPLAAVASDLVELFPRLCQGGSRLYLLPVYYAGGTAKASVSSDDLAARLIRAGVPVEVCGSYEALERALIQEGREGDAVLVMGARDPELPGFCARLVRRLG
ncbi:MAG: Mur ligase domain-containing protein [Kiritimatiellia bacterium]